MINIEGHFQLLLRVSIKYASGTNQEKTKYLINELKIFTRTVTFHRF